ncbi:MAG: RdgB/HAM1 family non-canonical purine NTP pyrophosphatase [Elusimicrobiota bacterium]|nr:RdgB/HAM1 family non-canonical purine NTP pyrophosphatase [Elusimicrobiota bacterium]
MNKKTVVLATNNPDKVREIKNIWRGIPNLKIEWMGDFKDLGEAAEDGSTLRENAFKKADYVTAGTGLPAVADDTGLFVDFLGGRPGIHSARYAGDEAAYADNIDKLLREMKGVPDKKRTAEFKTSVCLTLPGQEPFFTRGVVKGRITKRKKGSSGFGYDPVFEVSETGKTYAQMPPEEKDRLSHRYKAFKMMGKIISSEVAKR